MLYASLAILVVAGVWAWQANWLDEYRHGLVRGGWLTLLLIGVVVLLVIASFSFIFVVFHEVFFQAGTWTFLYSDTVNPPVSRAILAGYFPGGRNFDRRPGSSRHIPDTSVRKVASNHKITYSLNWFCGIKYAPCCARAAANRF